MRKAAPIERTGMPTWLAACVLSLVLWVPHFAFAAPGALDATFGLQGKTSFALFGVDDPTCSYGCFLSGVATVAAPSSKYLISGTCQLALNPTTNTHNLCLARVLPDGSLDTTFGSAGRVVIRNQSVGSARTTLTLGGGGTIFAASTCYYPGGQRVCVTKIDSNGSPDPSFGVGGTAYASPSETFGSSVLDVSADITLSADGKITVLVNCVGNSTFPTNYCLLRFTSTGVLDTDFGSGGLLWSRLSYGDVAKFVPLGDGRVLLTCSRHSVPVMLPKDPSNLENDGDEKEQIHGRTDHWVSAAG